MFPLGLLLQVLGCVLSLHLHPSLAAWYSVQVTCGTEKVTRELGHGAGGRWERQKRKFSPCRPARCTAIC